jgi:hypothetical protein
MVKAPKTSEALLGQRKFLIALSALVVMVLGLVLVLAFKQLTDPKWQAWCIAVAGICGAYITGNLVAKKLDRK